MEARPQDQLFENAQRIFDVASAGADTGSSADPQDFALLIRPDGSLHFVMEAPFSIEAAAIHAGARSAFRVTRSREGVRVEGRSASRDCVIAERNPARPNPWRALLPDQPLYCITSPLLTAGSAS
jgi:hypothetical protein